jgi:NADH:ubiquinone oxidoreductase subunit 5 (subunit L)/multisubunit Na+/H+ antiporter MnhA subunit
MILANIGFPLTINFIAECLIILTSIKYTSLINPLIIGAGMFLSVIYSFFLYNRVFFGYNSTIIRTRDLCHLETNGLVLLGLIVLIYGLWTKAYCAPPMELPELPKKPQKPPIILPHVIIEVDEAGTSQAINDPESLYKSSTVKDESSTKENKSALIKKLMRDTVELTIERDELRDRVNSQINHQVELTRVNKHLNDIIEGMIQYHGTEVRRLVTMGISGALVFTTYLSYTVYKF